MDEIDDCPCWDGCPDCTPALAEAQLPKDIGDCPVCHEVATLRAVHGQEGWRVECSEGHEAVVWDATKEAAVERWQSLPRYSEAEYQAVRAERERLKAEVVRLKAEVAYVWAGWADTCDAINNGVDNG